MIRQISGTQRTGGIGGSRPSLAPSPAARAEILPPVPVESADWPDSRAGEMPGSRPFWRATSNAAFLAQLIAARDALPQARERRRAEPRDGVAAYRAGLTRMEARLSPLDLALV